MDTPNLPNQPSAAEPPTPNAGAAPQPAQQTGGQPLQQQWREQPPMMNQEIPRTQPPTAANQQGQQTDPNGVDAQSTSQAQQSQDQTQTQQDQQGQIPQDAYMPAFVRPQPEEVLVDWQAESRPYQPRKKKHFTTLGLISILVSLILLFAGQFFFMAVVLAAFFLYYVLNTTPPGMVTNKMTTYGIRVEDNLYYWEEMGRFWFTQKYGKDLLHIEIGRFPFRLTMLLGDLDKDVLKEVLSEVLLYQVPPLTMYERVAKWFQEKLPIDIDSN